MSVHSKPQAARVVTADASKVSPRQFMDALGLDSPEERASRQALLQRQCIAAIEAGDTYGWPPLMVEDCKAIMEQLTEVHGDPFLKRSAAR